MAKPSGPNHKGKQTRPGRLRIVAGKWRSRLLPVADLPGLRPTSERARETLFNWLAPTIEGSRCLDLFAGSGALGFEALSRGAAAVTFVENSAPAVNNLRHAAAALPAADATIVESDALRFLQRTRDDRYDLVFLDPPFSNKPPDDLCRLLAASNVLADDARVYLERKRGQPLTPLPPGWSIVREKSAGTVSYTLISAGTKEPRP